MWEWPLADIKMSRPAGAWLHEVDKCWSRMLVRRPNAARRVDLTGVTFIDAAGKACLKTKQRQGAEFIAPDCLTKAVVAEITATSSQAARVKGREL